MRRASRTSGFTSRGERSERSISSSRTPSVETTPSTSSVANARSSGAMWERSIVAWMTSCAYALRSRTMRQASSAAKRAGLA